MLPDEREKLEQMKRVFLAIYYHPDNFPKE